MVRFYDSLNGVIVSVNERGEISSLEKITTFSSSVEITGVTQATIKFVVNSTTYPISRELTAADSGMYPGM